MIIFIDFNLDLGLVSEQSSVCHLCHQDFDTDERSCACYCGETVHLDCYRGDGDSCPMYQSNKK